MADVVTIETGARLHFGLLAVRPTTGRRYGGLGAMIDTPGVCLEVRRAAIDAVSAPRSTSRVLEFRDRCRAAWPETRLSCELTLSREIPGHHGFGSGTQLGLAVAAGLRALAGLPAMSAVEVAPHLGRAARSAIGVHGFDLGGVLIDAGQRPQETVSPLAVRLEFPAAWRWVLVAPRTVLEQGTAAGLSGAAESQAFAMLPPMADIVTGRLCRLLLTEFVPALRQTDHPSAAAALWEYGQLVGDYFAAVQGGAWSDPRVAALAAALARRGVSGMTQTSWGPTMAILCADEDQATDIMALIPTVAPEVEWGLTVTTGRNTGATVTIR